MLLPEQDLDHVLEHTRDIWADLRGERVFITGGTGFVGKWLVESFVWANNSLNLRAKAVVLSRRPPSGETSAIEYIQGDGVTFDYPAGQFPFVIHAATERPHDFDRDTQTTARVLDFANSHGIKKFLFTSSGAVYGTQPPDMTHLSETYIGHPITTYGQAKRASELLAIPSGAVIARLFAFVGPDLPLDAHYAVGNFIGSVLKSHPVRITGDGTPYRSYLYAADLAIWLWTMLMRGQACQTYNVGSPEPINIASLAELVVNSARPGTSIIIEQTAQPGMLPPRYVPNVEKAGQELGLKVSISLLEAIRRTHAWHLNHSR